MDPSSHRQTSAKLKYIKWPVVTEKHCRAVASVAISGRWHYGEVYRDLEKRLGTWLNGTFVLTTSSCAWSIFLALRSLGIRGKVAVPAYGYHGTVHPIIWAGAEPFFIDCDPRTFNICPEALRSALSRAQIGAVVAVHMHGMPFDYGIVSLCHEHGVPLIEDVCQAQGAKLRGQLTGTLGTCAAFSFNSRKTLPAGLGGALAMRDKIQAARASDLRDYGSKDEDNMPREVGYYLPISEFDAALILAQLDDLQDWISHANSLAGLLRDAIPSRFPLHPEDRTHTWHKVRIKGNEDERRRLQNAGLITSRWAPKPLTECRAYKQFITTTDFPGAAEICERTFCLFDDEYPLQAQTERVVRVVATILQKELS